MNKDINSSKGNIQHKLDIVTAKDLGLDSTTEKISSRIYSVWVRILAQNWRQGTVGCKGRSDVALSGKKPWKQKGTGRARAGTARSPLWRGGGVIFGPQERSRKIKLPQGVKHSILNSMFVNMTDNKQLGVLNWVAGDAPNTKSALLALKNVGLADKKIVLIVKGSDFVEQASFVNLPNVELVLLEGINAYEASRGKMLVCFEKDLNDLKEVVSKWR